MPQRYRVTLAAPANHLVEVSYQFTPSGRSAESLVTMAAWCPGSYLIRDYARLLRSLRAYDQQGAALAVRKVDKSTWAIITPADGDITVNYAVYGHELTVRTNHIDASHAFLHGPATFVYYPELRDQAAELTIVGPPAWRLCSGLAYGHPALSESGVTLQTASIDELFDMPLHLGQAQRWVLPSTAAVELVIWGERMPGGVFTETRLVADLAAIVDDHIARVGEAPFEHYSFVVMLTADGYGGLEHRNSSINIFAPNFAASRKNYDGLLELLSHEFFHAWNGKRIAPAPLLHFDYSREAYTPCLWVMEGVTSHYDRWSLASAQRISDRSYLEKVLDDWTRLLAVPGRSAQSLEQSSFDAWIKLYKPDESNLNTTVSYYLKGGLAVFALDLEIRRRTDGVKCFDDVLRALWQEHGKLGLPHPDNVQPLFERVTGLDLHDWFDNVVRGTADPELQRELAYVGVELRASADPATTTDGVTPGWLGVTMAGIKVTGVFDASPAQRAGVSPGDELIAIDGFRCASDSELRNLCASKGPDATMTLAFFRRGQLMQCTATLAVPPATRYEMLAVTDAGPAAERYARWLGKPHVAAQILATVLTTSRSA
ncbi:MAG: M61 family metallopeptidase [Kofleriaceae bacterium]|nr:M61 family metallopeptidase [Kofleriaceae bacterium]